MSCRSSMKDESQAVMKPIGGEWVEYTYFIMPCESESV